MDASSRRGRGGAPGARGGGGDRRASGTHGSPRAGHDAAVGAWCGVGLRGPSTLRTGTALDAADTVSREEAAEPRGIAGGGGEAGVAR
eukprot:4057500-Pleurochrysis_carterae.AAC.1